jgi:hypothetical protein
MKTTFEQNCRTFSCQGFLGYRPGAITVQQLKKAFAGSKLFDKALKKANDTLSDDDKKEIDKILNQ